MSDKIELPTVAGDVCGRCRFWHRDESLQVAADSDNDCGYCKRFPPVWTLNEDVNADDAEKYYHWSNPVTEVLDWCGEWQAKRT